MWNFRTSVKHENKKNKINSTNTNAVEQIESFIVKSNRIPSSHRLLLIPAPLKADLQTDALWERIKLRADFQGIGRWKEIRECLQTVASYFVNVHPEH